MNLDQLINTYDDQFPCNRWSQPDNGLLLTVQKTACSYKQGARLGLSLSYDIVKAHGGEIVVESEMGKGSEFVITLPIV